MVANAAGMLKLTKKADYGLIALRHLASKPGGMASTKEIAEAYLYLMRQTYGTGQVIGVDGGGALI